MNPRITGLYAALITPLREDGGVDYDIFEDLISFVLERGVDGICVGGATSEYPGFDLAERKELITRAGRRIQGKGRLLCGVGAHSMERTIQLAHHAQQCGASAVLVPPPHFFPYDQRDLDSFFRKVCSSIQLPCLLYNLPQFTSPLELDTIIRLLLTAENLSGIKDSSGDPKAIGRLQLAREQSDFSLLVGNDRLISTALPGGWDGIISGFACLFPELLADLYAKCRAKDRSGSEACQNKLDQVIAEADRLPFPWGIRIGLALRGFPSGPFPLPLAPFRRQQVMQLRSWLSDWMDRQMQLVR